MEPLSLGAHGDPEIERGGRGVSVAFGRPCRAARAAREPYRRKARGLSWQKTWWLKTVRYLAASRHLAVRRLNCGHRLLEKKRWDAAVQRIVGATAAILWQEAAQYTEAWQRWEGAFIARVLRGQVVQEVRQTRHLLREN